jgi:hypothetical protein
MPAIKSIVRCIEVSVVSATAIKTGDHVVIPIGTPCSPEQQALNDAALAASFAQTAAIMNQPRRLPVTPAMLAAGRAAFKRNRKLLDDLWQAFDCDIDAAVRDIYREMARAADIP